ncbi:riboflavine-aldehyde-forming enzyme [Panus rudis PR-1116 ss-1]|nr:riboflavine-aldehyde-forming enzyme [Panus rudis PR-1116 ss-1]
MHFTPALLVFTITAFHAVTAMPASAQFTNARVGSYTPGLGACGKTSFPSDFVAALNTAQLGSNLESCFKEISLTYQGKTIMVQVVDDCPACAFGNFDISPAAFATLGDPDLGVLQPVTWNFV